MSPTSNNPQDAHSKRMDSVEKRLDTLEAWRYEMVQWANDQHAELLAQIVEGDTLVMQRIADEKKSKGNMLFYAVLAVPGWVVSIASILIQYLHHP